MGYCVSGTLIESVSGFILLGIIHSVPVCILTLQMHRGEKKTGKLVILPVETGHQESSVNLPSGGNFAVFWIILSNFSVIFTLFYT